MTAEENKAVLRRWIEAYNERDLEAEADVLAPDYVAHVPAAPGLTCQAAHPQPS